MQEGRKGAERHWEPEDEDKGCKTLHIVVPPINSQ